MHWCPNQHTYKVKWPACIFVTSCQWFISFRNPLLSHLQIKSVWQFLYLFQNNLILTLIGQSSSLNFSLGFFVHPGHPQLFVWTTIWMPSRKDCLKMCTVIHISPQRLASKVHHPNCGPSSLINHFPTRCKQHVATNSGLITTRQTLATEEMFANSLFTRKIWLLVGSGWERN